MLNVKYFLHRVTTDKFDVILTIAHEHTIKIKYNF